MLVLLWIVISAACLFAGIALFSKALDWSVDNSHHWWAMPSYVVLNLFVSVPLMLGPVIYTSFLVIAKVVSIGIAIGH